MQAHRQALEKEPHCAGVVEALVHGVESGELVQVRRSLVGPSTKRGYGQGH